MKKGFKAVTAAALAISALTPVAAFAAENTVENGVYTTTNFYSLDAFKKLSGSAKAAALTSEGAVIVVAGKVYTGANVISLNDSQLDASAVTVDAYNAANDNKLVSGKPIGGENQAGELKVESVSAINAKEIAVKFATKVDKSTVDSVTGGATLANVFAFTKASGSTAVTLSSATLQADGKTVVLALSAPMDKNSGYDVTVKADEVKDTEGKVLTTETTKTIHFTDDVKPTVSSVKVNEAGKIVVKFSEKVNGDAAFHINGTALAAGSISQSSTDESEYTLTVPSTVTAGSTIELMVSSATDYASNAMNIYTTTIPYSYTVVAPKITGITAKSESVIEVAFDKALTALDTTVTANEVKVSLNGTNLTAGTDYNLATASGITDNSKYEITLTATGLAKVYPTGTNSATVKVTVEKYKDTLTPANVGVKVEKNITLNKDVTKPAIKGSAQYTAATASAPGTITVNLSEKIAVIDGSSTPNLTTAAANMYVLDTATGVKYTVSGAAAAVAGDLTFAGAAANAEKLVITNGDTTTAALPNGSYQLVIEKDTLTDTNYAENTNDKVVANFTVTGSTSTVKPSVKTVAYAAASNNTIVVTYNSSADTPAGVPVGVSATDGKNYKLNGVALTDATITLDATKQIATIVLPEGKFADSKSQILTISGVKSVDGVAIADYEAVFDVKDNTAPELKSATVVDGSIILTFNENVDSTTLSSGSAVAFADTDFVVNVNGLEATGATAFTVADVTGNKNQLKLTPVVASGINFTTATTLTVSTAAAGTATAKDVAGNLVKTGTKITIK